MKFGNLHLFLNILNQNMTLIAFVFPRLRTAKDVVRKMVKKPRFRTPFDSQHTKGCQNLLKSGRQHFYHFYLYLEGNGVGKILSYSYLKPQVFMLAH